MVLHRHYEEQRNITDIDHYFENSDLNEQDCEHLKEVRRLLEERLEQKRLKELLADDFDDKDLD